MEEGKQGGMKMRRKTNGKRRQNRKTKNKRKAERRKSMQAVKQVWRRVTRGNKGA